MPRLFVAVWPPPEIVDALRVLPRTEADGLRYTTADQWHVTLRFLGDVDVADAAAAIGTCLLYTSTGIGMTWDEHGADTCHFQAAMGAAGQKTWLVPVILDSIEGMTERLTAGATVVDIGCGAGVAASVIAAAYPHSTVIGIDPSTHAIEAAQARADEAGLDNLSFRAGVFDDLADLAGVDLLLTLDVIHDLPRPGDAVRAARRCV